MMDEFEIARDERLRPCPFCGSTVAPHVTRLWSDSREIYEEHQWAVYEEHQWAVICNFNKGGCGGASGVRGNEFLAIDLWNRRAR